MRRIMAIILIILVALAYGACGSSPAASADMAAPQGSFSKPESQPVPSAGSSLSTQDGLNENKKIVRNASLGIEVDSAQTAYVSLRDWVVRNGGYEFSSETSKSSNYWVITAQLKISPDLLDAFLDFAKTQGELINSVVTSNDITDQYVDTQIRLQSAKNSLNKYYEFLNKTVTIDDTLKVQNEINRLTADIESYEGLLNLWDSQVSESTIDLTIREKQDPTKIKKEVDWNAITFSDMLNLMKNGFVSVTNIVVSVLQWTFIVIVAASPAWIIAGIVFYITWRKKKRNKQVQTQPKDNPPVQKTPGGDAPL